MNRIAPGTGKALYGGVSVVDYLKSEGQDSSFSSRAALAKKNGISGYTGSASQNTQLIAKLKSGSTTPAPSTPTQSPNTPTPPASNTPGNIVNTPSKDTAIMQVSQNNSTYGKDPMVDSILASKYVDSSRGINQSVVEKIGMETGIFADIENIQAQVLEMNRVISMPDNDIFSRTDISDAKKIQLSKERKNTATNKITQLRRIQQSKQQDINYLAEAEQKKADAQAALVKQNLEYANMLQDSREFELEQKKFNLDLLLAQQDINQSEISADIDLREITLKENEFFSDNFDAPSGNLGTLVGRNGGTLTFSEEGVSSLESIMSQGIQIDENNLYRTADDQMKLYGKGRTAAELREAGVPESYAKPNENVVTWTLQSDHMGGNAVDVLVPKGQDPASYLKSIEPMMNSQGFFRDPELIKIGDLGHFEFKGSKKVEDKDNYEFETVYDYLNSTNTNIDKQITPETAKKILASDMQDFTLPTDKLKNLIKLQKIDNDTAQEYTAFKVASQLYAPMTDDQIVSEIKTLDFDAMTPAERTEELVILALADKLDTSNDALFDLGDGIFNLDSEAAGYLDDYFDDLGESISQAKTIAQTLKEKYNLN